MAKTIVAGLAVAAVVAVAQIKVDRSEGGGQATAIGTLRAITSAQSTYAAAYGGYARSLRTLSEPCPGVSAGFISPDLDKDPTVKAGYEIRLQAASPEASAHLDCHGQPTGSAYYVTAVPIERSTGETHAFAVDQNQLIWHSVTGVPPTPPFHETSTIHPLR